MTAFTDIDPRTPPAAAGDERLPPSDTPDGLARALPGDDGPADTDTAPARDADIRDGHEGERRCLADGQLHPRDGLIRFVVGPDQTVVPDIAEKLPGPGLWVTASRDALAFVIKKGLFAKAAKQAVKADPSLPDLVEQLLRRRCGELLGMAKGAGIATIGESQTEAALRANKIALFLRAEDAARPLDNRHNAQVCAIFSRDALGAALGYDHIVYAGLHSHGLTTRLRRECARLQNMLSVPPQTDPLPLSDTPAAKENDLI